MVELLRRAGRIGGWIIEFRRQSGKDLGGNVHRRGHVHHGLRVSPPSDSQRRRNEIDDLGNDSLVTYHWRANAIRKRGSGPYDDRLGPTILCFFLGQSQVPSRSRTRKLLQLDEPPLLTLLRRQVSPSLPTSFCGQWMASEELVWPGRGSRGILEKLVAIPFIVSHPDISNATLLIMQTQPERIQHYNRPTQQSY